ncbi:MAG: hypothetical protein Q8M76_05715 [Spirochaetaceae bacterium]|nr:hypothetical protein [Spirochaetaceae bacterium]
MGIRRAALVLLLAASALGLSSCSPRLVSGFSWTAFGERRAFRQSSRFPTGKEGLFEAGRTSNRYILREALEIGPGMALAIRVQASGQNSGAIRFAACADPDGKQEAASGDFALAQGELSLVLPLPATTLASVAVSTGGTVAITSVEILPAFRGFEKAGNIERVSAGFSIRETAGSRSYEILSAFAGLADESSEPRGEESRAALVLEYGASSSLALFQLAASGGDGASIRYSLLPRTEGARLSFGPGLFPAGARRIVLTVPAEARILAFYAEMADTAIEELADLGRILASPPRDPTADFDIYRWELEPRVLVADFKDYSTQDKYLRRLAFFVEKAGFRGKLLSDSQLEGRHAYNAHDYRPEDLAAFFEAARASSFPLSGEELELRALFLDRGLIALGKSGRIEFPDESGAFISISRESASWLRRSLLVHESTHGLFFCDPEYRRFARSTWASVGEDERWFWEKYLGWAAYDTSSDYLMANEFQAYLLQLPLNRVEEYFTKQKASELATSRPALAIPIAEYMAEFGASFAIRASVLSSWLVARYGASGPGAILLERLLP